VAKNIEAQRRSKKNLKDRVHFGDPVCCSRKPPLNTPISKQS